MDSQLYRRSSLCRKECQSWCQGFGRKPHRKGIVFVLHQMISSCEVLEWQDPNPHPEDREKTNLMD